MGSIQIRGKRGWKRYYGQYKELDGKLVMRALAGAKDHEDAKLRLKEAETRVAAGQIGIPKRVKKGAVQGTTTSTWTRGDGIQQLITTWLDSLVNDDAKNDRARAKTYFLPTYGKYTMAHAEKTSTAIHWLDDLRVTYPTHQGQTLRHIINIGSRFFTWAAKRDYTETNPFKNLDPDDKPRGTQKSLGEFLASNDEHIVEALMTHLEEPIDKIFWLGNKSCLRPDEPLGLLMKDFNFLHLGIIRVGHGYQGKGLKEDTRHTGMVKDVPAHKDTEKVMGPWLSRRRAEGATDDDLVFEYIGRKRRRTSGIAWKGYERRYVYSRWKTATQKVGITLTRQKATRHSFISRNMQDGVPKGEIQRAAHHMSPTTTDRYDLNRPPEGYSDAIRGVPKPKRRRVGT